MRRVAAENNRTPPEVLDRLAEDGEWVVRNRIASNPNTQAETITRMFKTPYSRLEIASLGAHPNAPEELLCACVDSADWRVRRNVAKNPNAPPDALARLAEDRHQMVRQQAAMNSSTPPEALAKLAEDEDRNVRWRVAENPSAPPEILAGIYLRASAAHFLGGVMVSLAGNPNTPPEILAELATKDSPYIERAVAQNPSAPAKTLTELVINSEDKPIRDLAAQNPNLPEHIRAMVVLGGDP